MLDDHETNPCNTNLEIELRSHMISVSEITIKKKLYSNVKINQEQKKHPKKFKHAMLKL
jgi:hypothetical protein